MSNFTKFNYIFFSKISFKKNTPKIRQNGKFCPPIAPLLSSPLLSSPLASSLPLASHLKYPHHNHHSLTTSA